MLLFKPYPRNKKRSAAIWLLEQIVKKKSTRITEFSDINYKQERSQINRRVYDVYTFQELSLLTKKYTQFDLRTALELLLQRKHIEIVNQNNSDLYDCSLQALWEGHAALIEETYNDEIETFLGWIKPFISSGSGTKEMYAIVIYEESEEPTIYYLD